VGWIPAVAGTAILLLGAVQASAQEPAIPNFFDPDIRTERPPVGAVPSIRFVTSDDFPPFNFPGPNGQISGFNVELARAVCDELVVRCTIQARPFGELAAAVKDGRADAAIGGLAITAETQASLDFSAVYLKLPARFVAKTDSRLANLPAFSLHERWIAVAAGTAHEAFLAHFMPTVERLPFPTPADALGAMLDGRADTYFGDGMQLSFWLASDAAAGCCTFVGGPYIDARFFGEGLAIAIRPGEDQLRRALDSALEALQADGTLAEIYLRSFPISFF
jgi:polar amino acid transport system substrate-binding protein